MVQVGTIKGGLIDNKTKYLDAGEASQWELVNPDDLVADCQWDCLDGNEFPNGDQEGPCGNYCGAGAYCCNGALNDDSPDAICTSDQRAPLRYLYERSEGTAFTAFTTYHSQRMC